MSTINKMKKIRNTQNAGHIFKYAGNKGIIFSLDAMISFVIMLICALLFVFALNNYAQKAEQGLNDFELEEKALLVADSFVKNFDENNTMRGGCFFDADKKRVRTNELTLENIKKAKSINFGKIFVKSITYNINNSSETLALSSKKSNECISAKRFVLIDREKAIILIQTCREG